jgi:DNA-binding SARP family transcriptional activator
MTLAKPPIAPTDAGLTLVTLGDVALFRAVRGDEPHRLLDTGKNLALLVYLTSAPGREAHREQLCDLFWSQLDPENALRALRQALHYLRSRTGIGDELFERRGERIVLVAPIQTDRDQLLSASTAGDIETVIRLYRGDFLAGFAAPGTLTFERWVEAERQKLRRIFAFSAEQAIRTYVATSRTRDALALARRARDVDRQLQSTWRRVLECCVSSADAVAGRIELEAFRQFVAVEGFEIEPAMQVAIRDAEYLLRGASPGLGEREPRSNGGLIGELVGRESAFATLIDSWPQAERGTTRRLQIVAPPGLGKTRLLMELRTRLRTMGARVTYVRANHAVRDLPYAFASDVATAIAQLRGAGGITPAAAGSLVALNPGLATQFSAARDAAEGDEALRLRALALRELVSVVTDERPLVLLLDDMHWSDGPSRRLLRAAFEPLAHARLLIVMATRPMRDEPQESSDDLIALHPLSDAHVAALMASIAELPATPWAEELPSKLCAAAAGSPLLVLELLQALGDQRLLMNDNGRWSMPDATAAFALLAQGSGMQLWMANLDLVQREILEVLSIAGVGLDIRSVASAIERDIAEVDAQAELLERSGLLRRTESGIAVAHDNYSAAVIDGAPPARLCMTAARLGRALAAAAENDYQKRAVAAAILVRAEHAGVDDLGRLTSQLVRDRRVDGDRRSNRALIRDMIGNSASEDVATALIKRLPWLVRAGLVTRRRIAAALAIPFGAIALIVAVWLVMSRPTPLPDARFTVYRAIPGKLAKGIQEISVFEQGWDAARDIPVDFRRRPRWTAGSASLSVAGLRPDGRGWTTWTAMPDSGGLEIVDYSTDGRSRRLTNSPHDDMQPTWSPDNAQLAFVTSRWNTFGQYDIAVLDTLSQTTRQLTSGPDRDLDPHWSSDGSRLAFRRDRWTGGQVLCVVDVDGTHLRCIESAHGAVYTLVAWRGAHEVVVSIANGDDLVFVSIDVETSREEIVEERAGDLLYSPDGRWALCVCTRRGFRARSWMMYPVGRPNAVRLVSVQDTTNAGALNFGWSPHSPRAAFVETVRIHSGFGNPKLGTDYQLRATTLDRVGLAVDVGTIRWRSLDSNVATIDAHSGLLHSRQVGRVVIEASTGGWRTARMEIEVEAPRDSLIADERWAHGIAPAWIGFGDPKPIVVSGTRLGNAFKNNGDDNFFSGAYSARNFDASNGVWVEADISAPLTAEFQQQDQALMLFQVSDPLPYRHWDHRTGERPGPTAPQCRLSLPGGDGIHRGDSLLIDGGGFRYAEAPRRMRSGAPLRALVQLMPDGRCAFAVNGNALWIGRPLFTRSAVKVELEGRSVGTDVVVGRLTVHYGVAPHIRWNELRLR